MAIVLECASKGVARFRCAQAGCSGCMRNLLREHSGLVYRMVNRLASGKVECADLFQEGRIGLWRAILHYEVGRGVAFSSYACVVIQHHLWEVVKRSQKAEGWLEVEGREEDLERVVGLAARTDPPGAGRRIRCLAESPARGDRTALWTNGSRTSEPGPDRARVGIVSGTDAPTARGSVEPVALAGLLDPFAQYL
jgi:RNA polymerase sigma factor (sigma-70 family)